MITRSIKTNILRHWKNISIIGIIGARQVGKTTLAKNLKSEGKEFVFLDL